MNIALWSIAVLLAVAFLVAGAAKLFLPKPKLAALGMKYVEDFRTTTIRAIGALEVLAGVGLILPGALDVVPVLVPFASVGLVALMVGAVAWGRFGPVSFTG